MFQNLIHQGGLPAHLDLPHDTALLSADYYTAYLPIVDVTAADEPVDEVKAKQKVVLDSKMRFKTPKGRALVSLNPALEKFFSKVSSDRVLEPGERFLVEAVAKQNFNVQELLESVTWLYRVSILI